jgi:DNA polymerase-3 subunit beta
MFTCTAIHTAEDGAMQVVLPRAPLVEDLRLAERLLPVRATEPLLEHVLLRAGDRECTLLAYDREVALWLRLAAEVERPGAALVPGRRLLAVLRQADAETVRLETAGEAVRLDSGGLTCELVAGDPARFPDPGPFPPRAHALLSAGPLGQAIRRTLFAAARGPGYYRDYLLEAILCEVTADMLRLVASDNRRLAVAEVPLPQPGPDARPRRLLLSGKALGLLGRLTQDQEAPVRAFFGPPHAFFRAERATLAARLLRGRFPDWRAALPPASGQAVELPVAILLAGVRQAAVLREPAHARLRVRMEPGQLILESRQSGAGTITVRQAVGYTGAPRSAEFNPVYLLDLLRVLEGDATVRLELGAPGQAAWFVSPDGSRHVLMTLRPATPAPEPVFASAPRAAAARLPATHGA